MIEIDLDDLADVIEGMSAEIAQAWEISGQTDGEAEILWTGLAVDLEAVRDRYVDLLAHYSMTGEVAEG